MLTEMKYVYTIYKEKSFSKAAKVLNISQPALSAAVKKLEYQIGQPIFKRDTVPLTVTPAGEYFIKCAEEMLRLGNNMQKYFDDSNKALSKHLVLGGSSYFCSYVYPNLINEFHKTFPNVKVEINEGNVRELLKGIEDESLDIIFETAISDDIPNLNRYYYASEYVLLAVPTSWPINEELTSYKLSEIDFQNRNYLKQNFPGVPLLKFKDSPFIRMKPGNDQWARGSNLCKNAGFVPKAIFDMDQVLTSVLVASSTGCGAVFIRDTLAKRLNHEQVALCYYKIDDPLAKRSILVATKKKRYVTKAMKDFLQMFLPTDLPEQQD